MTRVRIATFSSIAILAVTMAALAQGPGRPGARRPHGGPGSGGGERLASFLELTDEQIAQSKAIREATRTAIEPLAAQRRANREAIRAEIDGGSLSAEAIGRLVIASHEIGDQICAIRSEGEAQFVALLTPGQKEKYEQFRERRAQRRGDRPILGPRCAGD
ncbi:MAG TPA: Spy/CpxP family protein refolding chaperone [Thermoanaerobaculia bacterium]|nr:Spy/CpxP family protein refolding chaperone [Thermoanaerobaculia bacterium]